MKITGKTPVGGNTSGKNQEAEPLNYLSNFWRALEMLLINCAINLILTRSENCAISSATRKNSNRNFISSR